MTKRTTTDETRIRDDRRARSGPQGRGTSGAARAAALAALLWGLAGGWSAPAAATLADVESPPPIPDWTGLPGGAGLDLREIAEGAGIESIVIGDGMGPVGLDSISLDEIESGIRDILYLVILYRDRGAADPDDPGTVGDVPATPAAPSAVPLPGPAGLLLGALAGLALLRARGPCGSA